MIIIYFVLGASLKFSAGVLFKEGDYISCLLCLFFGVVFAVMAIGSATHG